MKNLFGIIYRLNKYWIAIIVFFVLTFILGDSNLKKRISYDREIHRLKSEIEYNTLQKAETLQKLESLKTDGESLEKLAREQYRMKKPDEDLFIIVE